MEHRHAPHGHLVRQLGTMSGCRVGKSASIPAQFEQSTFTCLRGLSADLGFAGTYEGVVEDLNCLSVHLHYYGKQL